MLFVTDFSGLHVNDKCMNIIYTWQSKFHVKETSCWPHHHVLTSDTDDINTRSIYVHLIEKHATNINTTLKISLKISGYPAWLVYQAKFILKVVQYFIKIDSFDFHSIWTGLQFPFCVYLTTDMELKDVPSLWFILRE